MDDELQIRKYLMGELGAEESDELDSRVFLEDEFFLQVQVAERSLADDFVAGELSSDEERRFRELCARSAGLQRMVDESVDLQRVLERRAARRRSFRFRLSYTFLAPAFAVVACVVLGYFLLAKREAPRGATNVAVVTQAPVSGVKPEEAVAAGVPTFFLAAIVTRGDGEEALLRIAPDTKRIEIQIEVSGRAVDADGWKIELVRRDGATLLDGDSHLQRVGSIRYLACSLDTGELPDGRYALRFAPLIASASPVERAFRIRRSK